MAGESGDATQIGCHNFTTFRTGPSQSRLAFLSRLCGGASLYVINDAALDYMKERNLPQIVLGKFKLPRARFDRIFKRASTGYVTLDRLLRRLFCNKDGLLRILQRPEIPINANASENDIRAFVAKRKISGGTVGDNGRDARDIMLVSALNEGLVA
jgi:hypothetical protein